MEKTVEHWKQTGLYNRLKNISGDIVVEGRENNSDQNHRPGNAKQTNIVGPESFTTVNLQRKSTFIGDSDSDVAMHAAGSSVIGKFEEALRKFRRCLLIAVCR
jgi:hypothetical protein